MWYARDAVPALRLVRGATELRAAVLLASYRALLPQLLWGDPEGPHHLGTEHLQAGVLAYGAGSSRQAGR